ncbi:hypothetical protein RTBOTA2_006881 [Rhodotorula toruloides]|nr:hypothetical protein RTBOTA2_006881 [Rhodotorula toruloides]
MDRSQPASPDVQAHERRPQEPGQGQATELTHAVLAHLDEHDQWRRAIRKLERFAAELESDA